MSRLTYLLTAKVSEEVNRKCPARNTTVQLSTPTRTMSERHRQTDGQSDRQTQYNYDANNSRSLCKGQNPLHQFGSFPVASLQQVGNFTVVYGEVAGKRGRIRPT